MSSDPVRSADPRLTVSKPQTSVIDGSDVESYLAGDGPTTTESDGDEPVFDLAAISQETEPPGRLS
jgi:hypothetical protein